MDKMDDFLKKRLTDYTPDTDGWNIPSEELWENALPHFPKEEKSNRKILFFWFCLLVASITCGLFLFDTDEKNQSLAISTNQSDLKQEKANNTKYNAEGNSSLLSEKAVSSSESKSLETNYDSKSVKPFATSKDETTTIDNKENNKITLTNIGESQIKKNRSASKTNKTSKATLPIIQNNRTQTTTILPTKNFQDETFISYSPHDNRSDNHITDPLPSVQNNPLAAVPSIDNSISILEPLERLPLTNASIFSAKEDDKKSLTAIAPSILLLKPKRTFAKREVGLAHLAYPVYYILKSLEFDTDAPQDIFNFHGTYQNANSYYTHWFAPRWSVSTGVHYSRFDLGLSFQLQDTVTQEIADGLIDRFKTGLDSRARATDDLDVKILDGKEILEGDIVSLRGDVGIVLKAFQIPLMVNYHFYKRKFEYGISLGYTLDILYINQKRIELNIFKEGELSAFGVQNPIYERETSFSVYTHGFMRYNITPRINIGTGIKINLSAPVFSGFETGIFYRWNR